MNKDQRGMIRWRGTALTLRAARVTDYIACVKIIDEGHQSLTSILLFHIIYKHSRLVMPLTYIFHRNGS